MKTNDIAGMLRRALVLGAISCAFVSVSPAFAQDTDPVELSGDLTIVTGIVDGEVETDADARLRLTTSTVVSDGLELGAAGSVRLDVDAPAQQYLGGRYSSLLAGGTRGLGGDAADVFLDGAYLFAKGSFGTIHVGQDAGVASRLSVTSPSIFSAIGVNDWRTDLTGLNDVHTINDLSGQAAKISYMPPGGFLGGLIGQLQLGLSYAPEIGDCDDDGCAPVSGFVIGGNGDVLTIEQTWRDVLEAAVYYQNGFDVGDEPLTIGFSASYVTAEDDGEAATAFDSLRPLFGDYRSYTVGMNVAYGGVTLGGSVKSTNSGFSSDRDEDYLAFDAGVTYETGEWNFMVGYGAAEADRDARLLLLPDVENGLFNSTGRNTQAAQAGISYVFDHGVTLGAAAQIVDSDKSDALGGPEDAAAVVFESSIKF